jgi:hypothetical protein
MQKWEYLEVEMYGFGTKIILDGQLVAEHSAKSNKGPTFREIADLLGEEGWEMTGVISDYPNSNLIYFKRPKS